ncbi:hypothetical protein ACIA49_21845 [Kribbella sp. NPDC051587]|uniref:hypothetical protein n=1 Tax=Kribbella sp. NPDC051587 TaxID=3364119 RepID=UPI0037AA70C5
MLADETTSILELRISGGVLFLFASGILTGYFWVWTRQTYRRLFRDRLLIERSRAALQQAESSLMGGPVENVTDFENLWNVTQRRLDYYHDIATGQAEKSFAYGQRAAWLGLALIVLCALLAILAPTAVAAGAAGALGLAGGGLAGYIGRTFMRTQESAAAQLRAYFSQPLEFSRFLAAERMLTFIEEPVKRGTATVTVISALVGKAEDPPVFGERERSLGSASRESL